MSLSPDDVPWIYCHPWRDGPVSKAGHVEAIRRFRFSLEGGGFWDDAQVHADRVAGDDMREERGFARRYTADGSQVVCGEMREPGDIRAVQKMLAGPDPYIGGRVATFARRYWVLGEPTPVIMWEMCISEKMARNLRNQARAAIRRYLAGLDP